MKPFILSALALAIASSTPLAIAQTSAYSVQVPVTSVPFTPTKTTFNFGNVIVGQQPQHQFTFVNKSTGNVTVNSTTGFGSAVVIKDNCSGQTLAGGASCTVIGSISVYQTGASSGEIRVVNTASSTPDVFAVSATGVQADEVLTAVQPYSDFGTSAVNVATSTRTLSFKNIGTTPLTILDMNLADSNANFILDASGCFTTLAPGASCSVQASFKPLSLGVQQGAVHVLLDNGVETNVSTLVGTGVQGTPSWSVTQLNYMDGTVGTKSADQTVTLTNTGKGVLSLTSTTLKGDNSFKVGTTTCGTTLAPNASCTYSLNNTPVDSSIRTAYLEVQTANSSQAISRIQLYSRPAVAVPNLSVTPSPLNFGNVNVLGTSNSKTLPLTLKSTGSASASVSQYTITGTDAAAFSLVNPAACVGTLTPGNQCSFNVRVQPTKAGALSAFLQISSNLAEPLAPIPLLVTGQTASVSADTVVLGFGTVSQGATPKKIATLTNTGTAPAHLNSIATTNGTVIYTPTPVSGSCTAGMDLQPGASCTYPVTFNTSATPAGSSPIASFVMNFDSGPVTINASGTVANPTPPIAAVASPVCPPLVTAGTNFTCTVKVTNTDSTPIYFYPQLSSTPLGNSAIYKNPTSDCPGPGSAGLAANQSCTITLYGTAPKTGSSWSVYVSDLFQRVGIFPAATVAANQGSLSFKASTVVGAAPPAVPAMTFGKLTCDVQTAPYGTPFSCSMPVANTGNVAVTINAGTFFMNTNGVASNYSFVPPPTMSHNCGTSLAAGATCTVSVTGGIFQAGNFYVGVSSSVPTYNQSNWQFIGTAAHIKLDAVNHPLTQYGQTTTAVHTVTNYGTYAAKMLAYGVLFYTPNLVGSGHGLTDARDDPRWTCTGSLPPGSSCKIVTRCVSNINDNAPGGTVQAVAMASSDLPYAANISCPGTPGSIRLQNNTGGTTTAMGSFSASGNWYRVTNTGVGNLSIQSVTIANTAKTPVTFGSMATVGTPTTPGSIAVFTDSNNPNHCYPNALLAPNASCIFLVSANLPATVSGQVVIKVTTDGTAPATLTETFGPATGLSVTASKPLPSSLLNSQQVMGELTITNQAPYTAYGVAPMFKSFGTTEPPLRGLSITSHNCSTLAPKGQPGSSCQVQVMLKAPDSATQVATTFNVLGAYPQVLNGVPNPAISSGFIGSMDFSIPVQPAMLAMYSSGLPAVTFGGSSTATLTLKNFGTLPVNFTGPVTSSANYMTITNSQCSGTLKAGQSCTVQVVWTPTTRTQTTSYITFPVDASGSRTVLTLTGVIK